MRAPERLHGLDVVRGLAAIAVLVFHWQFLGSDSNRLEPPGGFPIYRAIGEAALSFLYQCGASAVGLFFTLSGFVFSWLFREAIRVRRVSGWHFFVDRFSRLYPLHVATLLLMALGQHAYASMNHGVGWTSAVNSSSNFVKQLLVFPLWTPHRDIEFNLPVWSLVVEALIYVQFYFIARRGWLTPFGILLMLVAAHYANLYSSDISYGMTSFFMGGLVYAVFERLDEATDIERPLLIVVSASWAAAIVFGAGLLNLSSTPLHALDHVYAMYVLHPCTVLYLAILETRRGALAARWSWLGDATYSIYLLGFPMLLAMVLAIKSSGQMVSNFRSPLHMLAFVALVIIVSLASHRYFERPIQRWLRTNLATRKTRGAGLA